MPLIVVLLLSLPITAQEEDAAQGPAPPYGPPPENIFGIVEGMWFPELTCELNPGWERIIFDWSAHQPESAEDWFPFFNIPDEWLQAANDCNREVIAVVKATPAWATDGAPGAGVPRGLFLPVDDPDNVWAAFMRRTAEYYATRGVKRFIIWNEPDIRAGTYGFEFEGTLEDYVQMVKVAYLAAKEGNPAATIHLAGTTYWHDVNSGDRLYTDRLLEALRNDPDGAANDYFFEALSLHIYFRTDSVYDIVSEYRALLDSYDFDDKEIWITETNASPNLDPDWQVTRPQFQISLEQQAAFVLQSPALALAAGADRIAVYKLYDQQLPPGGESFGLLRPRTDPDGPLIRRPAFYAWGTVIDTYNGVESARLAQNDRVNAVQITHDNQRMTLVAWSRFDRTTQLEVSATADKAYLINLYGGRTIIRPQDGVYLLQLPNATCEDDEGCVVGGMPVIFTQPMGALTLTEVTPENRYALTFAE